MSPIPYIPDRKVLANHILFDANEHYSQWVKVPISGVTNLNRYPDQHSTRLRKRLSSVYCKPLKPEHILISAGSIEAIDLLMYALRPDQLIINVPSYDAYKSRASMHNVPTVSIPLKNDGQPNVDAILLANRSDDLLILINPNNPTGHLVSPEAVKELIKKFRGIIVVDEAYIEYAGLEKSFQHLVEQASNIIVLRTFSKAWVWRAQDLGMC